MSYQWKTGPSVEFRLLAVKTVRQQYQTSADLLWLLDEFRRMVNVCIMIGIEQKVSSLRTLSSRAYSRLSRDMLGYYRLGAIGAATVIIRNYRKAERRNARTKLPYAKRLVLTSCYGFKIDDNLLKLPVKPRTFVYLKLNSHTLKVLSGLNVSYQAKQNNWSYVELKRQVEYKERWEGL